MISTSKKQFYIQFYVCCTEDEDAFAFVIDAYLYNGKKPLLTTDEQLEVDDLDFTSSITYGYFS